MALPWLLGGGPPEQVRPEAGVDRLYSTISCLTAQAMRKGVRTRNSTDARYGGRRSML